MSDSEVLTLALCAQWHGTSERAFLRFASQYWRAYFPRLLSQSATNRRCRDLAGVLSNLSGMVAQEMESYAAPYQVLDTLPVRLMRPCRGRRRRLFGNEASMGKGGSDRTWYYGCKLLLSLTPQGVITGFSRFVEGRPCWPQPTPKTCGWLKPSSAGVPTHRVAPSPG